MMTDVASGTEERLVKCEVSLRAIARNTRPKLLSAVGLLTAFAVWRVLEVAHYDYSVAAEIVTTLNPLGAFLGFAVAYRGLFFGAVAAAVLVEALHGTWDEEVRHPGRRLTAMAACLALLAVWDPSNVWNQALWVVAAAMCLHYAWTMVVCIAHGLGDPRSTVWRLLGNAALLVVGIAMAGRFQPLIDDDRPWQPVKRVTYASDSGSLIVTMTGAFLTDDQAALTYLQLEPRRIVWIKPAQIQERQLCDRTGENCKPGRPG